MLEKDQKHESLTLLGENCRFIMLSANEVDKLRNRDNRHRLGTLVKDRGSFRGFAAKHAIEVTIQHLERLKLEDGLGEL